MNITESPVSMPGVVQGDTIIHTLLKNATKAQRMDMCAAAGWKDDSSISQILNGRAGVMLKDLDAILRVLDLSIQEGWFMEYLGKGNSIGANCCKARASMGYCRPRVP